MEVERRVRKGTAKKAIALEVGIGESELGRKLRLTGKNRLNVDEVFRLAGYLGGPIGWPWLPRDVARRLVLRDDERK